MSKSGENSYSRLLKELATSKLKKREAGSRRQLQDRKEVLYSIEKEFITEAVMVHAGVLREKFPGVDLNDVIISTQLMLRQAIDKFVDGKKYQWLDASKENLLARNFRAVQDLMTAVKKDLRQQARNSLNITSKKLVQEKEVQSTIVLTGTDVRDATIGGDLLKEDLKNGVIIVSANKLRNRAQKFTPQRGTEVGHTFTIALGNIAAITKTDLIGLFDTNVQARLFQIEEFAERADANLKADLRLFGKSGKKEGQLTVTIVESSEANSKEGGEVDLVEFRKIITDNLEAIYDKIKGSPTIAERYQQGIIELFLTGKVKPGTRNSSIRIKTTVKSKRKVKVYGPKLTAKRERRPKKEKVASQNIQQIIDLLNIELHDKIRENMGKGTSKQILNYRTGRFAKSAKVQNLIASREKNAITAQVKYMRDPYRVFEKGGHLHKVGRDPKRIFGRSIRQILQEQKIANLRRVKVELRG